MTEQIHSMRGRDAVLTSHAADEVNLSTSFYRTIELVLSLGSAGCEPFGLWLVIWALGRSSPVRLRGVPTVARDLGSNVHQSGELCALLSLHPEPLGMLSYRLLKIPMDGHACHHHRKPGCGMCCFCLCSCCA